MMNAPDSEVTTTERMRALLDLYKQQMQHFQHTQDIEWKANFGVWALLGGAIFFAKEQKQLPHIPLCFAVVVALMIVSIHAFWLHKTHRSEVADKTFWIRYRREALLLIREDRTIQNDEEEKAPTRTPKEYALWLSLEVSLTFLLTAALVALLALRS